MENERRNMRKDMDSHVNTTERLFPLFPRNKRVTAHQLGRSLRKMGFKSWNSFLPGNIYYSL